MEDKINIYVYGTLRKGQPLYRKEMDNYYIRTTTIKDYTLVNLGSFPTIVQCKNLDVVVELYKVPKEMLKIFDRIEGYPNLYNRIKVKDERGAEGYIYIVENVNDDFIKYPNSKYQSIGRDWVRYSKLKNRVRNDRC